MHEGFVEAVSLYVSSILSPVSVLVETSHSLSNSTSLAAELKTTAFTNPLQIEEACCEISFSKVIFDKGGQDVATPFQCYPQPKHRHRLA